MTIRLVSRQQADEVATAQLMHNMRAAWLESILVDRSRFRGVAGKELERKLRPLKHDEQACADRTMERIRRTRWRDNVRRPPIVEAFRNLLGLSPPKNFFAR